MTAHDALLERAQSGDDAAFADSTEPYRRELHLHCYGICELDRAVTFGLPSALPETISS